MKKSFSFVNLSDFATFSRVESSRSRRLSHQKSVGSAEEGKLPPSADRGLSYLSSFGIGRTNLKPDYEVVDRQQHRARQDYILWHDTVVICY